MAVTRNAKRNLAARGESGARILDTGPLCLIDGDGRTARHGEDQGQSGQCRGARPHRQAVATRAMHWLAAGRLTITATASAAPG